MPERLAQYCLDPARIAQTKLDKHHYDPGARTVTRLLVTINLNKGFRPVSSTGTSVCPESSYGSRPVQANQKLHDKSVYFKLQTSTKCDVSTIKQHSGCPELRLSELHDTISNDEED